jgi:predicted aconitase
LSACHAEDHGFEPRCCRHYLDSAEVVEVPKMVAHTCQLITGINNQNWRVQGIPDDLAEQQKRGEEYFGSRGINMFATCTPYQVGNVPGAPTPRAKKAPAPRP